LATYKTLLQVCVEMGSLATAVEITKCLGAKGVANHHAV